MTHQMMALKINDIKQNALKVQEVLTENDCLFQARLDFHKYSGVYCFNTVFECLLLQKLPAEIKNFKEALDTIDRIRTALISL